ncbi:pyridoxal phosphate-dependent aminotransferase [Bailinhaonella thermotolerans]|uniref:pyridoxal phosphate-dependent aminotransferase n=1 Tax=Bailinhaonella thermotolerans TaxID=1070861 RepID=UPI00192A490E|nr:pyridoxal phosphate-dependent aminotransferase [Bailinhaonella thermotolerans]
MSGVAAARERSRSIPVSSLHEIHRLVRLRGPETIALHVGEPYIRMPQAVTEAFARAVRDGLTSYTDAPGLPELREALAARFPGGGAPSPERVFVTPGSCQAIAAVLQSVAFEGGVALLPEVHWPIHLQQVLMAGLRPRFYADPAALDELWSPEVCALVVNSPANPSGVVLGEEAIAAAHAWAARRRVWLISDEAYEDFVYAGAPARPAALDAALPAGDRVVFSVRTFSKGFSMTGCRLGYVAAPTDERARLLRRVQEATLIAPSTPVQYAGLAALACGDAHLAAHHAYVRATRDEVVRLAGPLLRSVPDGGWYALLDLSAHTADSDALCRELLDSAGVAVAPGRGFVPPGDPRGPGLARLTLCWEREVTLEGVRRLLAFLGRGDAG